MHNVITIIFIGEHSYELCWFTPKMRKLCNEQFKNAYKIVFARNGKYGLYRDFVSEFIPFDSETEEELGWPACGGTRNKKNNQAFSEDLDPAAQKFVNNYCKEHEIKSKHIINASNFNKWTGERHNLMGTKVSLDENPWGDYIHLTARPHIQFRIAKELEENLDHTKPTIAMMARTRKRLEMKDNENWNPAHWQILIDRLINELDVNIVFIGVPPRNEDGYPGALSFDGAHKRVYSMVRNNFDAVEEQIAVLLNTKVSFYGASGASYLAMFCNTPSFIFSQSEDGWRLKHAWCKELTDGHKNIYVFNKYKPGKDYWNANPDDVFKHFKNFYEQIS